MFDVISDKYQSVHVINQISIDLHKITGVSQSSRWSRSGGAEPTDVQVSPHWCLRPKMGPRRKFSAAIFSFISHFGKKNVESSEYFGDDFLEETSFSKSRESRLQTSDNGWGTKGTKGKPKKSRHISGWWTIPPFSSMFFPESSIFLGDFLDFPATFDTRGYLSHYISATLNGTMFDLGLASINLLDSYC